MTDEQNQLIMSRFEKEGHSFLIRLWKENRDNPMQADVWRGWVQHVQSNQKDISIPLMTSPTSSTAIWMTNRF
ncbi:MAG: hypothetical protein M5U34_05855 [Chloroflexi bacterium]|nr:hypothetical protein [Chloroflexota bacterium]